MPTVNDLQNGVQVAQPQRIEPNKQDWSSYDSGINLNTFGYADNFETGFNFKLPFFIDPTVRKILEVGLTLTFQKFRGYTVPLAHTHTVTIAAHTHTVTTGNHTHTVTTGNHTHTVTTSNHTHGVSTSNHAHTVSIPFSANASPSSAVTIYASSPTVLQAGTGGTIEGFSSSSGGGQSLTSGSGGAETPTSSSGGSETTTSSSGGSESLTSSSGGSATPTSSSAAGASYGIFEDSYPAVVRVYMDGVEITANLSGPFSPSISTYTYENLDLSPFVKEGGLHVLELSTTTRGRAIPLLCVKSIISK